MALELPPRAHGIALLVVVLAAIALVWWNSAGRPTYSRYDNCLQACTVEFSSYAQAEQRDGCKLSCIDKYR